MVKSMVDYFSTRTGEQKNQINIIPGWVEPSDMEEIKRLAGVMGIKTVMFPDTSNILNGPLTGKYNMYPDGGVTIDELVSTGDSIGTVALGKMGFGSCCKSSGYKVQGVL